MQTIRQWNYVFVKLKGKNKTKKNCQPKILYPNKISFSTEFKITSLMNNNNKNKQKIRERYHQQTLSIRKVKRSSSNRRKTIPDGNLDIQKKILSTGNGNYIGKYNLKNFLFL